MKVCCMVVTVLFTLFVALFSADAQDYALTYQGLDPAQYVEIPHSGTMANEWTGDFTWECKINLASYSSFSNVILSKRKSDNDAGVVLFINGDAGFRVQGELCINGINYDVQSPSGINDATDYHIAFRRQGLTLSLLINGSVVATSAIPVGVYCLSGLTYSTLIGKQHNDGSDERAFEGWIDEVRFWTVARTNAEIAANMNGPVAPQANLVGYYRFNEGSGQTTADASGNGNTGVLGDNTTDIVNDPLWTVMTAPVPALGEWGMATLFFLMLGMGTMYMRPAVARFGNMAHTSVLIHQVQKIDKRQLLFVGLLATCALAIIGVTATQFGYSITLNDIIGAVCTSFALSVAVQLFVISLRE